MLLVLVYAATLFIAALISNRASRTALSTSVLFLVIGVVLGGHVAGILRLSVDDPLVSSLVELALIAVLFTDGMEIDRRKLRAAWILPTRALAIGMPLVFVLTTVLAHFVAGLSWINAAIVGAVLAPTDPVLAEAIIGRSEVPVRLRRLLNVESGLNDGLALPVVVVLTSLALGSPVDPGTMIREVGLGVLIGIVVPGLAGGVLHVARPTIATRYEPIYPMAVALLVLSTAELASANVFLAAFIGGAVLNNVAPEITRRGREFGRVVAEMLKLAGILVFGVLLSPKILASLGIGGFLFAGLTLLAVRPVAILLATVRSELPLTDRLVAGWFGPKGFSSMLYALLVLRAAPSEAGDLFYHAALVVVGSVVLHTTTDSLVAQWYARRSANAAKERGHADEGPAAADVASAGGRRSAANRRSREERPRESSAAGHR